MYPNDTDPALRLDARLVDVLQLVAAVAHEQQAEHPHRLAGAVHEALLNADLVHRQQPAHDPSGNVTPIRPTDDPIGGLHRG